MNRNIKMAWIAALRSGDYQQCVGFERCLQPHGAERVKHDPLGVLAELCEYETGESVFDDANSFEGRAAGASYVAEWEPLQEWAGLDEGAQFGRGEDGKLISKVIDMNDDGKSFDEIADVIEATQGGGNGQGE